MDETPVSDTDIRGMVAAIHPDWTVRTIERPPTGTDFVAVLEVMTTAGIREVVLKATTTDLVDPEIARSEPRLLDLVARETAIPVPEVYGYRDTHPAYPTPFLLLEAVDGENIAGRQTDLPDKARERVMGETGRYLAALHDLGPLPAVGSVGVRDGDLVVLDTDDHPSYGDFRTWLLESSREVLDGLTDGGSFPELAEDRERFADLVPDLRTHLEETIPALPKPAPPTYCHWDYRYGNLLLDPETGATRAVLDWANLLAADPAYNLAKAESYLFDPTVEDDDRVATLRDRFRGEYEHARPDWSFDDAVERRMETYLLTSRLDAMACLPLWYQDATPAERDARERQHRAYVARYL